MFPVLFRIPMPWGDPDTYFPVRLFGLLLIVAFCAGTALAARRARAVGTPPRGTVVDLAFQVLAAGLVGSRALYVALHAERFEGRWLQVLAIWEQGLVWWGGAALAALVLVVCSRVHHLRVRAVADVVAPAVALGLAIGWVGAFCAGDYHGVHVTDGAGAWVAQEDAAPAWSVRYPGPDEGWRYEYSETPADFRAPYHVVPTQIVAAGAHLALLAGLLLLGRCAWGAREGRVAGAFLVAHAATVLAVAPLRGDVERVSGVLGTELDVTQAGALPAALVGAWLLLRPPRADAALS